MTDSTHRLFFKWGILEKKKEFSFALVKKPVVANDEEIIKQQENAIVQLGTYYANQKKADALRKMIKEDTREFLMKAGKAKAAKVVRLLMDLYLSIEPTGAMEIDKKDQALKVALCQECIQWASSEKRVFLRQTLEARLVRLYNDIEQFQESVALSNKLVKELKKQDDKDLIVEVQLEESKAHYRMGNLTKARAALTSSRTTANAIYVPPKMQAALDMQSGILNAADEKDFKTAYSYFYEAFEGYDSIGSPEALRALKYMLLCKIMLNSPDEVTALITGKIGLKYVGKDVEALKVVAAAAKKRSLADFTEAFAITYKNELQKDLVIKSHFNTLYENMLEKNLCRVVQPYSRVQIDHTAKSINLPKHSVEKKLSQMILDKKINGILDQKDGMLIIYDDVPVDKTYDLAVDTVHELGNVVEGLFQKMKKLN
uniref:PCI domain-containing protein n=1 Tax=Romanomermis culicivorax TaxID=13658 RepID=A0A915KFA9_ROMCU